MKFRGELWMHQMNSHQGAETLTFNFANTQTGLPGTLFQTVLVPVLPVSCSVVLILAASLVPSISMGGANIRTSKGLTAQVSYNLSRANGNTATDFDETWDTSGGIQDQNDLAKEVDIPQPYDQRHISKGYVGYELPFGRGKMFLNNAHPVVDALLGGWNVTTIFKYNTGSPLGIYPDVSYPGWEGAVYANYDPSVPLNVQFNSRTFNPGNQADPGNNYFSTAAFSNPTNHKLGNGKRLYDELRTMGYSNEDIGLFKYWRGGERVHLQLRAELINAFNRHHYSSPGTSIGNKSSFGKITAIASEARVVQFGLRLGW